MKVKIFVILIPNNIIIIVLKMCIIGTIALIIKIMSIIIPIFFHLITYNTNCYEITANIDNIEFKKYHCRTKECLEYIDTINSDKNYYSKNIKIYSVEHVYCKDSIYENYLIFLITTTILIFLFFTISYFIKNKFNKNFIVITYFLLFLAILFLNLKDYNLKDLNIYENNISLKSANDIWFQFSFINLIYLCLISFIFFY